MDCDRAVRPRLGAARSGTGFPGLAAASKKFPVEHSPAGAGAAGAAVDVGGGVQAGEAARGRLANRYSPSAPPSASAPPSQPASPPRGCPPGDVTLHQSSSSCSRGGPPPCTAPLPTLKEAHPAGADTALLPVEHPSKLLGLQDRRSGSSLALAKLAFPPLKLQLPSTPNSFPPLSPPLSPKPQTPVPCSFPRPLPFQLLVRFHLRLPERA